MTDTLSTPNQPLDWRDQLTWPLHRTVQARGIELLIRAILPTFVALETTGVEHIPATGPCILTPNHIGNADPLVIGVGIPHRQLFFMAKKELYKNPIIAWIIRMYGTFPVERGQRDEWALRHASKVLEAGQLLCMFPEGTRSKNKARLGKGKIGTVKLALEHNVPVIPAAVMGSQAVKVGLKRTKVTVQIDQPIDLVQLAGPPPYEYQTMRELTTLIMQRIAAMLPPENRGVYE